MRPSLKTLAGMSIAAGSIVAGAAVVGGGPAAAQTDYMPPAPPASEVVIDFDAEARFATGSIEVIELEAPGTPGLYNEMTVDDGYGTVEVDLFEDGCPPCGMG